MEVPTTKAQNTVSGSTEGAPCKHCIGYLYYTREMKAAGLPMKCEGIEIVAKETFHPRAVQFLDTNVDKMDKILADFPEYCYIGRTLYSENSQLKGALPYERYGVRYCGPVKFSKPSVLSEIGASFLFVYKGITTDFTTKMGRTLNLFRRAGQNSANFVWTKTKSLFSISSKK